MTQTTTTPVDIPRGVRQTIHYYPKNPKYRLSGQSPPQVGDIARCGHRKVIPPVPNCPPANCVVCIDLERLAKLRVEW